MRQHLLWIGLSLLLLLSACSSSSHEKIMPDFKQNPHPKQAYLLTLTIANAPGPFKSVAGIVQFDVVTPECLPPPSENGGMPWPIPVHHIPIAWTRVSDTEYTGLVHLDEMIDEDYYGRGVCRWKLIQARADLMATGAKGETRFIPSIDLNQLEAQQAQATYFVRADYLDTEITSLEHPVNFGETERSTMTHLRDSELFTVSLAPKATKS